MIPFAMLLATLGCPRLAPCPLLDPASRPNAGAAQPTSAPAAPRHSWAPPRCEITARKASTAMSAISAPATTASAFVFRESLFGP